MSSKSQIDVMAKAIENMPIDQILEMAEMVNALEKRAHLAGPQTDDELHAWILLNLKVDVPRIAVCPEHNAPFEFLSDVYFERVLAAIAMANRGGAKTFMCVAGDTLIDAPRDHRRWPHGIPISEIVVGKLVYGFDQELGIFRLAPVSWVGITKHAAEMYKMELDDGSVIRATGDHRFLTRAGEWKQLGELVPGESLMPLYRDVEPMVRLDPDGMTGGLPGSYPYKEYELVADALFGKDRESLHVHHVDGRHENTSEDNFELMSRSDHARATNSGRKLSTRRIRSISEQQLRRYAEMDPDERERLRASRAASSRAYWKSLTSEQRLAESERRRANALRQHEQRRLGKALVNHSVVRVEPDGAEDAWDMEVEGVHSFVSEGVTLHNCAVIHVLNAKFRPGVEMASVGAIEAQARRAYQHVLKLLAVDGGVVHAKDNPEIRDSIMLETRWMNGSKLEVLGGTKNAVNGPHPQKVHFDEVELADPEVFYESRNMSQTANGIKAQDFITSTRKGAHGPMQKLIDEVHEAEEKGLDPPYHLYSWCCFETAENVPNCQVANPSLVDNGGCGCDKILKGEWDDGSDRTFDTICKGKLALSRGWIPLHDLHKSFRTNTQSVWEAQQECSRPSTSGLVIPSFTREKCGIRGFQPDPSNGPIYMSIDFGGTNPHAVSWYQMLKYELDATGYFNNGAPNKRLPEGSIVCFDEIYVAEVGNNAVADMIVDREEKWRRQFPKWRVARRFADPQAKAARLDFAAHRPPLNTAYFATRDVKEHIKKVKELFEHHQFYVDTDRAPMFCDEIEAWHYPSKRASHVYDPEIPVDDFNHVMSNFRYAVANIFQLRRRAGVTTQVPVAAGHQHGTVDLVERSKAGVTIERRGIAGPFETKGPVSSSSRRERFMP